MPSGDDRVVVVRAPARIAAIIRELERAAVGGDVQAARELRAWLEQYPPDDGSVNAASLDEPTRAAVREILARALAELAERQEGKEEAESGMVDQTQATTATDGGTLGIVG